MAEISGGEVIARMLQKEGVEKVFGIIDGTYFGFYSALHRLGIEIVTPRHETCAAHMAGTYARLTGRPMSRQRSQNPVTSASSARPFSPAWVTQVFSALMSSSAIMRP